MSRLLSTVLLLSFSVSGMFTLMNSPIPASLESGGQRTVDEVIDSIGESSEGRLKPWFDEAGVSYPPEAITLLALKDELRMELWADEPEGAVFIRDYRIHRSSGKSGPKLREGDFQVPEGLYRVSWLNPNSAYHLSMKLNYPNAFDLEHARAEGRDQPGSDIFIHGKAVSIGCLAMGDETIEELFSLVARIGANNVSVVIAPSDPRLKSLDADQPGYADWVSELYADITAAFDGYRTIP